MITLGRTKKQEEFYQRNKKKNNSSCPFCEKDLLVIEFKYWIILNNRYPYNNTTCHLLCPKRHIEFSSELKIKEFYELEYLKKNYFDKHYDVIVENIGKNKSIKNHYHLHLIKK